MKSSEHIPPELAKKLLCILVRSGNRGCLLGDLEENYSIIVKQRGLLFAFFWYWYQTLIPVPNFILTNFRWSLTMFNNYFKIALRNLLKQKVHSFINIAGLAIGMAVCFVILLYVLNELSYDNYHQNKDRIYRVIHEDNASKYNHPSAPYLLAPTLISDFPEVEKAARVRSFGASLKKEDRYVKLKDFVQADGELLDILSIPLIEGNPEIVLDQPNEVIISEEVSDLHFPEKNPVGKVITVKVAGKEYDLKITGIFKTIPRNSTFRANYIASLEVAKQVWISSFSYLQILPHEMWNLTGYSTYILITDKTDPSFLGDKITALSTKHLQQEKYVYSLQSMKDFYFKSDYLLNNRLAAGNLSNVYLFSSIAFLVLLIAIINFIVLTTARSTTRAKEIGVRKVLGASIPSILSLILREFVVIVVIANVVAWTLTLLVVGDWMNNFVYKVNIGLLSFVVAGLLALFIALLTISFHAIKSARANPVDSLRYE